MRSIETRSPENDTLCIRLIREATGAEGNLRHIRSRTPEDSAHIQNMLKHCSTVHVDYFYNDALLKIGEDITIVQHPADADRILRVAGLHYPQINCVEEALCDFELGNEVLRHGPVFVHHATPDPYPWIKLQAFVSYALDNIPPEMRPAHWRDFPVQKILAEADERQIEYTDGKDYKLLTAAMEVPYEIEHLV